MEIPVNTKDDSNALFDKTVEGALKQMKEDGCATIYDSSVPYEIARRVANAFIAKGYHASEYINRQYGWCYTFITTGVQSSSSATMSYTKVIG